MPLSWFKKKLRPRLIELARRRIGSSRRGPVQKMEWTLPWIQNHPADGRFLLRESPRKGSTAVPLNQTSERHPAFASEHFRKDWGAFVAEIRGGYVVGPSVGVITPNRRLLTDVSFEFSGWPESHSAMRKIMFKKPVDLHGNWALLATTGGDSYYHHMAECTPRMELLQKAGWGTSRLDGWLVNDTRIPFQRETWRRLGLNPRRLRILSDGSYYRCERLILPSLPTVPGRMLPETVIFLKKLLGTPGPAKPRRLLYLPRKDLPSRRLLDEKAILEFLLPLGFEVFLPGKMTVREQARIFAEARIVVGPHGGAMTNTVFMRPGSLVVEFFNPRYVNPCYWRMAWANRCRYAYLIGEAESSSAVAPPGDAGGNILLGPKAMQRLKKLLQREFSQNLG